MLSINNCIGIQGIQQLFSPVCSSSINAVGIKRRNAESGQKYTSVKDVQVPVLPSYIDRILSFTALLPLDKAENVNTCDQDDFGRYKISVNNPFMKKLLSTNLKTNCCSIRTFKTKTSSIPNNKKSRDDTESKENLTEVIKQFMKNSEKKQEQSSYFTVVKVLPWILMGGGIIGYFMYKTAIKAYFGKSVEDTGVATNVTFNDIRGADEVKAELVDIVEYLKDPKKFTEMGAKLPKGILLVGPPGTGKTLLAKAVACEAGVSFFYASGSEFDEMLVGMGALRVRQLFDKARKRAPAIIFLDEIDACGGKRANTAVQPYARQTINQLLQEMDGFTENDHVVVLAATNDVKVLDKALIRPGRFDTQVQVLLPDIHGRKEILRLYLDKLSSVAGETIDLDRFASLTIEMTGADLSNLVNQAALRSIKLKKSKVDQEDMEFALDKVRMGPELKTRIRTDKQLKETAYHEAGHALVAYYTPAALNIYKATIIQRGPALGHVSLVPSNDDELSRSKQQLLASIDVCMGGRVAEELMFGKDHISTGASSDIEGATSTAYRIVCQFGMSEKLGPVTYDLGQLSEQTKQAVEHEVRTILQNSYDKARRLLNDKPQEHKLLAESLLRYESLTADEIKLLLETKNMDAIKEKRERENEEKLRKKLEEATASSYKMDVSLQAPIIDYVPLRGDA